MKIKLRDDIREFQDGLTLAEIASAVSEGLARAALCAKVDGVLRDMSTVIDKDCEVEFLTFADEDGKKVYRHSAAHIMAQAVKRIYPTAKIAIGPAIENGFITILISKRRCPKTLFEGIEAEMKKIIKENRKIVREEVTKKQAISLMKELNEKYKIELLNDIEDSQTITLYRQGDFIDLCAGPHVPSTGYIKAFKLTALTGAYWRGDEKNKMLTRIYGAAFDKKSDMLAYLAAVEEAKKRDHNKLGRNLAFLD